MCMTHACLASVVTFTPTRFDPCLEIRTPAHSIVMFRYRRKDQRSFPRPNRGSRYTEPTRQDDLRNAAKPPGSSATRRPNTLLEFKVRQGAPAAWVAHVVF